MNDNKSKRMFKFLKRYVLTRPYWFHLGVILFALAWEESVRSLFIGAYKLKNQERSLEVAQKREKDYLDERKRTHPDEFEEEEEEVVEAEKEEDDE